MQRLSLSPSGGKKGWDIRKPTSDVSDYIAAGVTALLPGSGVVNNIVSNVISTGLSCIEKAVRGKEIDWRVEAAKTVASCVADGMAGVVTKKAAVFTYDKILPKNYSTYKHKLSIRHPNITREEVYHRIFFRRTLARGINSCTRFTVYSARAALPV